MSLMPLVSILIPLYNSEKYISKTLESCVMQTYKNIEIIVLDDGSTDDSLNIARKYEQEYENIKVHTHKNSGAQVTRNKLFELSLGDYIQYLDADDLLHKDKIKSQIYLLKGQDERNVVFGLWTTFDNRDNINNLKFKKLSVHKNYNDSVQFLIDLWKNLEAISPHAWLIPRVLIEESDKWDLDLIKNQDGEFFARVVAKSSKVIFSPNSKVYYRIDSPNSVSKNFSKNALESVLFSIDSYAKILQTDIERQDCKLALAKVYSNFLFTVYPEYEEFVTVIEKRLNGLGYTEPLPIKESKLIKIFYKLVGPYTAMKSLKFVKSSKSALKIKRIRG